MKKNIFILSLLFLYMPSCLQAMAVTQQGKPSYLQAMVAQEQTTSSSSDLCSFLYELLNEVVITFRFDCHQNTNAVDALFTAIRAKNSTQVATLLRENPSLLDTAEDADGVTPLLAATLAGDDGLVAQMLNHQPQPQVDRCSHQGYALNPIPGVTWLPLAGLTPLMAAVQFNRLNIANQLLGAHASKELTDFSNTGKKPTPGKKTNPGRTALDYAKETGDIHMISLLATPVDEKGLSIN